MSKRRPREVAGALVARVVGVAALGLILALVALVWTLASHLRATADADLDAATTLVTSADADHPRTVDEQRLRRILPGRALVAVVDADGEVRALSATAVDIAGLPLDHAAGDSFGFGIGDRHFRGRVIEAPEVEVSSADGTTLRVERMLIAIDVTSDRATVRAVTGFALGIAAAVLLALAVATRVVVARSLRPLAAMAAAADRIASTGAAEPMPASPFVETQALAAAVDQALTRRLAAEQAVRDFVADASHELRTPIAKVQGWTDLLVDGSLDANRSQAALDSIAAATEELAALVQQLALLARLDAITPGGTAADTAAALLTDVDLHALAVRLAEEAMQVAPDAVVGVGGTGPVIVHGNEGQLRTALRNLIGNAVQHGGGNVRIEVTGGERLATVEVADNGPGIPAHLRTRVLDRFFTTAAGNSAHSGLGLAIVAAVARAHDGMLTVDDAPGGGALLRLTLPSIVSKP